MDGADRRSGAQNIVEDGHKQQCSEVVQQADHGQQQHSRQPLQPKR
jgi:hypothetical protein